VRLLHGLGRKRASFDDPNLVSRAGLVPVMALAQRAGLAAEHVRPGGPCGVNAVLKVPCLVAGMAAGADSIDDMDLLRHGALPGLFGGIRAPSTLGSHLRSSTWGTVRQLEAVNRLLLGELARRAPLLPGRDTLAFVDIDAMQSPRRHAAPGPDQRRRPDRPARPRAHHAAPARRLAPRTAADDLVRSGLRPASNRGLTSPDRSPYLLRPQAVTWTPTPSLNSRTSRGTGERQKAHARIHCQDHIKPAASSPTATQIRPVD
jgi:hypothetical protein